MAPDFIGIGAQKAGTSWLWRVLKQHPAIWMSPIKELHHFDVRWPFPSFVQLHRRQVRRQSSLAWRRIRKGKQRDWYLRFLLHPRTDRWYESLFEPGEGQICGEITPAYARLSGRRVAHVQAVAPDVKIIYLLRNPVHRMWSQAAMYFRRRGIAFDGVGRQGFWQFVRMKEAARNSSYLQTLEIWERFYPPERMFIGFLDEIAENPEAFLTRLFDFLGVDGDLPLASDEVVENPNKGDYPNIPADIERDLIRRQLRTFEQLDQRFDNRYTARWLDYARATIGVEVPGRENAP